LHIQTEFAFEIIIIIIIITILKERVMFGHRRLPQGVLNDDKCDMTEVPKQTLNAVLDYLFLNFYYGVRFAFSRFE